jgi:hypothetical protein
MKSAGKSYDNTSAVIFMGLLLLDRAYGSMSQFVVNEHPQNTLHTPPRVTAFSHLAPEL